MLSHKQIDSLATLIEVEDDLPVLEQTDAVATFLRSIDDAIDDGLDAPFLHRLVDEVTRKRDSQ